MHYRKPDTADCAEINYLKGIVNFYAGMADRLEVQNYRLKRAVTVQKIMTVIFAWLFTCAASAWLWGK